VGKNDLYEGYREWCETVGRKPLSKTAFGKIMKPLFDETHDKNNRYWVGIRRKTDVEIETGVLSTEYQDRLSSGDVPDGVHDVHVIPNFSYTPLAKEKLGETCTSCTPPVIGGEDPAAHDGIDIAAKARAEYSPDPCDYVYLGRTEYNQQCAACGVRGVTYRERPQAFNVKRGTAGLCGACFEAISGRQEKTAGDGEEVDP
jgi:hypothetical protein